MPYGLQRPDTHLKNNAFYKVIPLGVSPEAEVSLLCLVEGLPDPILPSPPSRLDQHQQPANASTSIPSKASLHLPGKGEEWQEADFPGIIITKSARGRGPSVLCEHLSVFAPRL